MERQSVNSSNLSSVGYDASTETLEIEFKNGTIYTYSNVPQFEYDRLMEAGSHGSYFSANIRNRYPYEKS